MPKKCREFCPCFSCGESKSDSYGAACSECAEELETFWLALRGWIIKREIKIRGAGLGVAMSNSGAAKLRSRSAKAKGRYRIRRKAA